MTTPLRSAQVEDAVAIVRVPFTPDTLAARGKVSQYLGHSNSAVTERVYGRFAPDHPRDAAEVLEFGGLTVVK